MQHPDDITRCGRKSGADWHMAKPEKLTRAEALNKSSLD
jgi:hypothetical protein